MEQISSEQKNDREWPAALGAAITLVIFLLIAFSAIAGWDWTSRFLESSAPNWAQAIGSIVGIFIAIWVPNKLHKEERSERKSREWNEIAIQFTSVNSMVGALYGALDAASNHIGGIGLGTSIKQPQDIYRYLGVFPVPNDEQISKLGAIHVLMGSQLAQGKVAYTTVLNMLNNISDEDLIDNRRVLELLKTIIIFLEDAKTSFKNALESGKDFTKMVP